MWEELHLCRQVPPRGFPGTLKCVGASAPARRLVTTRSKARRQPGYMWPAGLGGLCAASRSYPGHISPDNDPHYLSGRFHIAWELIHSCARTLACVHVEAPVGVDAWAVHKGATAARGPVATPFTAPRRRFPAEPIPRSLDPRALACGHAPCIPNKWIRDPLRSADTTSSEHAGGSGGRGQHCAR